MTIGTQIPVDVRKPLPLDVRKPLPLDIAKPVTADVREPLPMNVGTLIPVDVAKHVPVGVRLVVGLAVPPRSDQEAVQPSARPAGHLHAPLVREALTVSGSARPVPHGATPSGSVRGPLPYGPRLPCV
ncbi:hypothetical protein ACFRDV_33490 [Streptomyces fagopyri]|uniref:hypothetical protein n=1 Tax=Streptomyces fagopyri TaxID=2662397 RepID=UPI0036846D72